MSKIGENTPQPYIMAGQYPLDSKIHFDTVEDLVDFIENENGMYKFYKGLVIFISETNSFYVYDEVKFIANDLNFSTDTIVHFDNINGNGLLFHNIQYPENSIYNGYDYSLKSYNFFNFKDYFNVNNITFINTGIGYSIHSSPQSTQRIHNIKTLTSGGNSLEIDYSRNRRSIVFHSKSIKNLKNLYVVDSSIDVGNAQFNEYKNWSDLKSFLIGSGTSIKPEHEESLVVFRGKVSSRDNLNLNNTIFFFDNSEFIYKGYDEFVLDNKEMSNDILSYVQGFNNSITNYKSEITLDGCGVITRTSEGGIIRSNGLYDSETIDRIDNFSNVLFDKFSKIVNRGHITLKQRYISRFSSGVTKAYLNGSNGEAYKNELNQDVFLISHVEDYPILELNRVNENEYVFENHGKLILETTNSRSILIDNSSFKNFNNSSLIFSFNKEVVTSGNNYVNIEENRIVYNPINNLSIFNVKSSYTDSKFISELGSNVFSSGELLSVGGYHSFFYFELPTDKYVKCNFDRFAFNSRSVDSIIDVNVSNKNLVSPVNLKFNNFHFESNNIDTRFVVMSNLHAHNSFMDVSIINGFTDVKMEDNSINYLKSGLLINDNKLMSSLIPLIEHNNQESILVKGTIYSDIHKNLKIK